MGLKRYNKALELKIQNETKKISCPIHNKIAQVSMPDEDTAVEVDACCVFFKKDIFTLADRIRKDYIYRALKTSERIERERLNSKYGSTDRKE
jgi:hypothetical protein